jgi:iron-sulfur cluster assembly protein
MATVEQAQTSGIQITVTDKAVDEVLKFMDAEKVPVATGGLRVSVLPGGCSGFKYSLNIEEQPLEDDHVIALDRIRMFVDGFSLQYLNGVTVEEEHACTTRATATAQMGARRWNMTW